MSYPTTSEFTRQDLLDMIARLRAAYLVDMPDLPKDRQTVAKHLLESTAMRNTEPEDREVVVFQEDGYVTLQTGDKELSIEGDDETYDIVLTCLEHIAGGGDIITR